MSSSQPATSSNETGDMVATTAKFEKLASEEPTTPSPSQSEFSKPSTAQGEKKVVKKTSTGNYQATRAELEEDPLERIQQRDYVCGGFALVDGPI